MRWPDNRMNDQEHIGLPDPGRTIRTMCCVDELNPQGIRDPRTPEGFGTDRPMAEVADLESSEQLWLVRVPEMVNLHCRPKHARTEISANQPEAHAQ